MDENKDLEEFVEETEEEIFEDSNIETDELSDALNDVKKAFNDVKEGISKSVSDLKEKIDTEFTKENLQTYLDEFTNSVNDVMNKANKSYQDFINDPKTVETWNTVNKVADNIKETAASAYTKAMENETLKKGAEVASDKYQEFIHNPKVRETVVGATTVVKEVFGNAVDAFKNVTKKDDQEGKEE